MYQAPALRVVAVLHGSNAVFAVCRIANHHGIMHLFLAQKPGHDNVYGINPTPQTL